MTLALERPERFTHEALPYSGDEDFVRQVGGFVREAVAEDEPVLVVVSARKIGLLRDLLGPDAEHVRFADMADVGLNPARIIPAWSEFVDDQSSRSSGLFRGVGEPIWPGRSADQLAECQLHESLLNVAFGGGPAWWLACPYDVSSLDPDVIDEMYRTHPWVRTSTGVEESTAFRDVAEAPRPIGPPLPEPSHVADAFVVHVHRLDATRRRVARLARIFGLAKRRVDDLVLAVSEVATNSLRYGGGLGHARVWTFGDTFCFEIRDEGHIPSALAGRIRPTPGQPQGYGLWLANQVCDLVQIRTMESGSVVRLHMTRNRADATG